MHAYNLLLLAEERVALQGLVELTLGDVREDLILSFIRCAVRDSGREEEGEKKKKNQQQHINFPTLSINLP